MKTVSAYKSLCEGEKQFLSGIAKDVAMLVVKPKKMDYFRKQLREFGEKWKAYRKAYQADRKGKWQPSMGKPSNPLGTIWPAAYGSGWGDDIARKRKPSYGVHVVPPPCVAYPPVLGAYALLSVIHDDVPSHCPSIAREILPKELAREIWRNLVTGRLQEDGMERIPNRIIENCLRDVKADIESHSAPKKSTTQKLAASSDLASKQSAEQKLTGADEQAKPAKEPPKVQQTPGPSRRRKTKKKRGRPRKHTDAKLLAVKKKFDHYCGTDLSTKEAWNKAADDEGIVTGKAAEMAWRRSKRLFGKQNK